MKIRGLLLIALVLGGMYVMIQSPKEYTVNEFNLLLQSMNEPFSSVLFSVPSSFPAKPETWVVDEVTEIESLLNFLQDYHVQKIQPEEITDNLLPTDFSLMLEDINGNSIEIIIDENLIIQNSLLYYEIVDGPLNVDWLVQFFIHNKI